MSLPKWTDQRQFTNRNWTEQMDRYHKALKIACEALTDIEINGSASGHWKDDGHCGACMSEKAVKAMRRIEELGK